MPISGVQVSVADGIRRAKELGVSKSLLLALFPQLTLTHLDQIWKDPGLVDESLVTVMVNFKEN